jgi:transposase
MRAFFMSYKKGESITQGSLFPVCLDELIPSEHGVRVIAAYVDHLALNKLGFTKSVAKATGRPPYDPADLLKLYLYGYLQRIRSSRRLEAECQRNVEVMWLLGRLTPDFKTIAEFRRLNRPAFVATCREFVQFCRRAQLITGELVAIDGSKFQAAASPRQHITPTKLAQQQAVLEQQITGYLQTLDQHDRAEQTESIDAGVVRKALRMLQHQQQENLAQQTQLHEQGLTQLIKTEPDARMMHTATGRKVSYNIQTAVDAKYSLIAHHEVTQAGNDSQQLLPVAMATKAVLKQEALIVVADAGYSNGEQFAGCEREQIEAYVPANRGINNQGEQPHFDRTAFTYEAITDSFRCPNHKPLHRKQMNRGNIIYATQEGDCCGCPLKLQCTDASRRYLTVHAHEDSFVRMHVRLKQKPEMMSIRRATVEHPFGNLKQWIFGNGRFLLWGLRGAETEMALGCMAYNLKRAMNILGVREMMRLIA